MTRIGFPALLPFFLALILAACPLGAHAQDGTAPAPERPTAGETGSVLSNTTIELRRPASDDETDRAADDEPEQSTTPSTILVELETEEPIAPPASDAERLLTNGNARTDFNAAERAQPLGTDTGLFSLGTSSDEETDAEAAPGWMAGIGGEFARTLGGLAVVLGLLIGMYLLVRRFGGPMAGAKRPAGVLEIMARYPIGRRQHLVLLKMGRRLLLLHQTGTEMRTLTDVSDPDEVADLIARVESGARDGRFSEALEREASSYRAMDHGTVPASTRRAQQEVEMVDLTRANGRWRRVLPRFGVSA